MEVRDKYIIDFIVNSTRAIEGVTKLEKAFSRANQTWERAKKNAAMNKELDKAGLKYNRLGKIIDKVTGKLVGYNEVVKRTAMLQKKATKKVDDSANKVRQFEQNLLSLAMSTFFFGMALKTVATNLLTSLITAFVKARGEGDFFVNRLLAIQAAFEFLKFAIFDAFANTEIFKTVTKYIIGMVNWLGQLFAKSSFLSTMTVGFILLAIAIGGAFMVIGFFAQGALAVVSIMTKLGLVSNATLLKIGTNLKYVTALTWYWIKVLALPIAALALLAAFVVVTKDRIVKQFSMMGERIKHMWDRTVDVLRMGWQKFSLMSEILFRNMTKGVVEGASWAVQRIVDLINTAISAYMKLPRRMRIFGDISQIDFKGFNTTAMTAAIDAAKKELSDLDKEINVAKVLYDLESASFNTRFATNLGGAAMDWNQFLGDMLGFKKQTEEQGGVTNTESSTTIVNNDVSIEVPVASVDSGLSVVDALDEYFNTANKTLLGAPQKGE